MIYERDPRPHVQTIEKAIPLPDGHSNFPRKNALEIAVNRSYAAPKV